jgi:hypothetical protein
MPRNWRVTRQFPPLTPAIWARGTCVDRHAVTPRATARAPRRLFAVHGEAKVHLRFLQSTGGLLLLRGISADMPVEVVSAEEAIAGATRVIGRIVYLGVVML